MPNAEELRWLRATANELNNLLHVIAETSGELEKLVGQHPDAGRYIAILKNSVERANEATRSMVERAGGDMPAPAAPPLPSPSPTGEFSRVTEALSSSRFDIENPEGTRELVLMVDDEEFITLLAKQVLSEDGYRVITARNGFQAIEIFKELKNEISLVILDFVMPVMDGADVFAELQHLKPNVSVVLSSGFAEQDRLRGMLAKGLRGFIPKPYTQKKLLEQVRQTLDALPPEKK